MPPNRTYDPSEAERYLDHRLQWVVVLVVDDGLLAERAPIVVGLRLPEFLETDIDGGRVAYTLVELQLEEARC